MNAVCHRDYESNGPVQFYQYDDRIEIMNPGGLYGKATPENFPYVNDYRNGVVAEGMKVLGFVNRYSRGVQTVQEELRANGNGEAEFKLHLGTAFLVIEKLSIHALKEAKNEAKNEVKNEAKNEAKNEVKNEVKNEAKNEVKNEAKNEAKNEVKKTLTDVMDLMRENPHITYKELIETLKIGQTTLYERIKELKAASKIRREGGKQRGHWIVED